MAFQDRELACRDCGGPFIFTGGEQEFYATKGLEHDPVRCPGCRATRKMMRPEDRDFAPSYGVYVSWGGRTPRQLHVANCAQCGGMTEVPFRPRDDRPVYCSDCYGDLRRKQEAQEAAEATAAAGRIATSGTKTVIDTLEGAAEALAAADGEAAAATMVNPLAGELGPIDAPVAAVAEVAAAVEDAAPAVETVEDAEPAVEATEDIETTAETIEAATTTE